MGKKVLSGFLNRLVIFTLCTSLFIMPAHVGKVEAEGDWGGSISVTQDTYSSAIELSWPAYVPDEGTVVTDYVIKYDSEAIQVSGGIETSATIVPNRGGDITFQVEAITDPVTDPVPVLETTYHYDLPSGESSTDGGDGGFETFVVVEDPIVFADPALAGEVRSALGLEAEAPITASALASLTELQAESKGISNLEGLQYATNLTKLWLDGNNITDISSLSALEHLENLDLSGNPIDDISAISGLSNLWRLNVSNTSIGDDDIVNLAIHQQSGILNLSSTAITDMAALAQKLNSMTLTELNLEGLELDDIQLSTFVSALTPDAKGRFTQLFLNFNNFTSLSAIQGTTGEFTSLMTLRANHNQISSTDGISTLTTLSDLGLGSNVLTDISGLSTLTNMDWLQLDNNQISDISALEAMTELRGLYLSYNPVTDLAALQGLTNLYFMILDNTEITDLAPLVSNEGIGQEDTLNIQDTPGLNLVEGNLNVGAIETLKARGVNVTHDNIAPAEPPVEDTMAPYWEGQYLLRLLDVTDTSMTIAWDIPYDDVGVTAYRIYVDHQLYTTTSDTSVTIEGLTPEQKYHLRVEAGDAAGNWSEYGPEASFTARVPIPLQNLDPVLEAGIRELIGKQQGPLTSADMEMLPTDVDFEGDGISDISGLEYATNVKRLTLWNNEVTDISPLASLALDYLDLDNNNVSDISALLDIYANGGFQTESGYEGGEQSPHIYLNNNPLNSNAMGIINELTSYGVVIFHDAIVAAGEAVLEADVQQLSAGDRFTVTVKVEQVPDLYAFGLELAYDHNVLGLPNNMEYVTWHDEFLAVISHFN